MSIRRAAPVGAEEEVSEDVPEPLAEVVLELEDSKPPPPQAASEMVPATARAIVTTRRGVCAMCVSFVMWPGGRWLWSLGYEVCGSASLSLRGRCCHGPRGWV